MYLIFLTNDRKQYEDMIPPQAVAGQIIVVEAASEDIATFDKDLKEVLEKIPKRIFSPLCKTENQQFTDIGMR